jgi:hypothetical protein
MIPSQKGPLESTALIHVMMCLVKDIGQKRNTSTRGEEEGEANGAGPVKHHDGPVAEGHDRSHAKDENGKKVENSGASIEQTRPPKAKPVVVHPAQWDRKRRGYFRLHY